MALGSGPKNAGKKPCRRKKTNKTRPIATEVVDLLQQNGPVSALPPAATIPIHQPVSILVHPPVVVPPHPNLPFATPVPPQFLQGTLPNANCSSNSGATQQSFQPPLVSSCQDTSFRLKWVAGTTVSRCYGCNGDIKNPPESIPDDLIVVYRDIRELRDRHTGQLRRTNEPVNNHFHLRIGCIRARYPNFPGASALTIPPNYSQCLRYEHLQRLNAKFGWAS